MKTRMVSYTLDTLPPLTKAQEANLTRLASLPDSEIDTSEMPEWTDEQWKNAVRGGLYRPVKQQITTRLDADVIAWLKSKGEGYQSRMNAILRREMLSALSARGKQVDSADTSATKSRKSRISSPVRPYHQASDQS